MSLHFIRANVLGFVGPTQSFTHSDNVYVPSAYSRMRVYYKFTYKHCAERVASFNFQTV